MTDEMQKLIDEASTITWGEKEIEELNALIDEQLQLENQLSRLEDLKKTVKEKLYKVQEVTLPDMMNLMKVSSFTYKSFKVTVKPYYSAKISEENEEQALNWLDDNGHTDLIKNEIKMVFKKGEDEQANEAFILLEEAGFDADRKTYVHHSTLKAFVKEQIENETPSFPLETFGVYVGQRSTIKGV